MKVEYFFIKRLLDILISIFLIFLLIPLFVLLSALIFTSSSFQNPFFIQKRPGHQEIPFMMIKFKTMRDKSDGNGKLLSDGERITKLGRVLRRLSLDELPQLFNVFKGDMSLIGPRPLLVSYLPLYNEFQRRRHEVKPGITGLAQIKGRNNLAWEERFKLDVFYVDNLSWKLDLKIMMQTFINVLRSKDINEKNQATVTPFAGNQ